MNVWQDIEFRDFMQPIVFAGADIVMGDAIWNRLSKIVKVCMTHSNTIKIYDCSWDGA